MSLVAFDVETHLIQPGLLAPPLVCASKASEESIEPGDLLSKDEALLRFQELIASSSSVIVGANVAYDMLVMAVYAARQGFDLMPRIFEAYEKGRVFDVQIAEMLHALADGVLGKDPNTGKPLRDPTTNKLSRYSLNTVTYLVLGRKDAKANDRWRLRYALLENTPIEEWPRDARMYPVDDAVNTLDVALKQKERNRNLHDMSRQAYAAWALHLGAAWGLRVDAEAVAKLEESVEAEYTANRSQFVEAGLIRPKGTKNQKLLRERIEAAYGADVPRTAKGAVATDRDTLYGSGDELLMEYAAFLEKAKLRETYIPWLKQGIGKPINLRPNVLLETGRVSYGDVVQQLPRKGGVRECIIPRPGFVFCSCDYSGIELVTHAQNCLSLVGESKLAEAINSGVKVHNALAEVMAGRPYDDSPFMKSCRQAAKAANFGFPGGMGALKLVQAKRKDGDVTTVAADGTVYKGMRFCILIGGAAACGVEKWTTYRDEPIPPTCSECVRWAEKLRSDWFKTWPENHEYFRYVASVVKKNRGEITQRVSRRVRGGCNFTSAANGFFQGLAADGAKTALCRVAKEQYTDRRSALWGSRTVLFAHDELLVEMPEARAHEAAMRLSEIMVESMREYTPDVKVEAPPALMPRWLKSAEPVFVDGRLVPWEP